ncbi:MAG: hydantoinase/oxoprolinase family protein [Actinomycetota bacterium]|nr:hydantoinase/oxoprolinase family protein [Actinomycetota bacterium]
MRTIGAGGGSLAWVDDGGALRVGPRSAGSDPGPAAYGLGGDRATVTDANVVLGRIPAEITLGGSVALDVDAARDAVGLIGSALGLSVEDVGAGIIEVVDTHMERALRAVSVEEGVDPSESVLVAFGGAGGLHASRLAQRLGMRRILIPPLSGVFSALGLLFAHPSSDATRTVMLEEGSSQLPNVLDSIMAEAQETFSRDHGASGQDVAALAEMRYVGQSHELAVPLTGNWSGIRQSFEAEHRARFGFVRGDQPIELVNVKAEVSGQAPLGWAQLASVRATNRPVSTRTNAVLDGRAVEVPVWRREELPPLFETGGPAIVVERDSALWLEPSDRMSVQSDGTLEIVS